MVQRGSLCTHLDVDKGMLLVSTVCEELHSKEVDPRHWGGECSCGRVVGVTVVQEDVVEDVRPL